MPWWLLGFSLVATTFAADTPLFVAGLVREMGVAANWEWWALLLSGMVHRVCLCQALATIGRSDRPGVLRVAL